MSSLGQSLLSVTARTDTYGIVVFSHLRWNFVWQRPQQFLTRFAPNHRILFIEEPYYDLSPEEQPFLTLEAVAPNIMVAAAHLAPAHREDSELPSIQRRLAREAITTANLSGEFDQPVLWYYSPMEASWSLDHFEASGVVYDCMDELSQFRGAPAGLIEQEARLMSRADVMFTGGYELWQKKRKQHENVHFFGCGVEYSHFAQAQDEATEIPDDIKNLQGPVIGWFGVVDERVDYDLLRDMAALRPDWSFVMVGPIVKVDPASLPQAPNLHWLGGRDYKVLPNYCKGYDVCMMAFALNEATEFINPTKALEYLATGKPVISTPVADVVRQYSDLVYIEKDAQSFVDRIESILAAPDHARVEQGIALACDSGWDNTVAKMQNLIDEAIQTEASEELFKPSAKLFLA